MSELSPLLPSDPAPVPLPADDLPRRDARRRSFLLFLFSILGSLGLLGRALQLTVQEVYPLLRQVDFESPALSASVVEACAMLFCVLLLLPLLFGSWRALTGHPLRRAEIPPVRLWQIMLLLGVWFCDLILVTALVIFFPLGWAPAIPFFLLGVALPVVGLVWVGAGGLTGGSWRRVWAALGLGMVGGTALALIAEYLLVFGGAALAALFLAGDPAFQRLAEHFGSSIENVRNTEELFLLIAPVLRNPLVMIGLFVAFAGLGPLVEELVKPLSVLLLGKSLRFPAEGFALGALGGAGFALLEGLVSVSGFVSLAGIGLMMRAAASLMHILASGLTGWGYASAILQRRYGRAALLLALAVGLHGLWNGATLLAVYGALLVGLDWKDLLLTIASILVGLGILTTVFTLSAVFLPLLNYQLRAARR
ncbi:MAG: hypothetical protein ABWK53_00040 [Anaerolineales bacterium]